MSRSLKLHISGLLYAKNGINALNNVSNFQNIPGLYPELPLQEHILISGFGHAHSALHAVHPNHCSHFTKQCGTTIYLLLAVITRRPDGVS